MLNSNPVIYSRDERVAFITLNQPEKLNALEKRILAMNVLEEYSTDEVARLLGCTPRNVRRLLQDALDQLSRFLLAGGLMEEMASVGSGSKTCQGGQSRTFDVSDSKEGENKGTNILH